MVTPTERVGGNGDDEHSTNDNGLPVDIDAEKKLVRVIVEMPGVTKESIKITGTENHLILSARNETREIKTEVPINAKVDPKTAKASYKNGVLDITLKLIEASNPEGVDIQVN